MASHASHGIEYPGALQRRSYLLLRLLSYLGAARWRFRQSRAAGHCDLRLRGSSAAGGAHGETSYAGAGLNDVPNVVEAAL